MDFLTKKRFLIASIILLFFSGLANAQSYKTIRVLGSNPVCVGGINTAEELQQYIINNQADFEAILASSGWNGDTQSLVEDLLNGDFSETSLPTGTEFNWMGIRKRSTGIVDAKQYIRWGGPAMPAFMLKSKHDGKEFTFVLPKACCNLALLTQVSDIAAAPTPVPTPIPQVAIAEKPSLIPFIAPFIGYEERARDICPGLPGDHGVTDDDSVIAGAMLGVLKPISENTSLLAQLGGAYNFDESSNSTFFADLGLNYDLSDSMYVSGGLGVWDINDSHETDGSYFLQAGFDIFSFDRGTAQWFVEGRALFDDPSDNKIFMTGIRFLFDN